MLAMYLLRLYSGEPQYKTIGRIGTPGLCIFAFCLCFSIILNHLMTTVVLFRCCNCIQFCNVLLLSSITLVILPISFFAVLIILLVELFSKFVLWCVNVITELDSIKDIFIFYCFVRFLQVLIIELWKSCIFLCLYCKSFVLSASHHFFLNIFYIWVEVALEFSVNLQKLYFFYQLEQIFFKRF